MNTNKKTTKKTSICSLRITAYTIKEKQTEKKIL